MRIIKRIIYHQTGYPNDTVESITRWHTGTPPNGLGWSHIGYHFVITPDGVIHKTLSQGVVGNHCRGDNSDSLGICCVGKGDAFPPGRGYMSLTMLQALLGLTADLLVSYPTIEYLHGHRERPSGKTQGKTCPGWEVEAFRILFKKGG